MKQKALINSLINVEKKELKIVKNIFLVVAGVIFLALFSQVKIGLEPFSPIPITGQTFAVALIGLIYGTKLGGATLLSYILVGSLGLPVYANGNSGFLLHTASGGYIIGFFFLALISGYFAEKGYANSIIKTIIALIIGHIVMYFFGLVQLSFFIKNKNIFMVGLVPYIVGDTAKIVLVSIILPVISKIFNNQK